MAEKEENVNLADEFAAFDNADEQEESSLHDEEDNNDNSEIEEFNEGSEEESNSDDSEDDSDDEDSSDESEDSEEEDSDEDVDPFDLEDTITSDDLKDLSYDKIANKLGLEIKGEINEETLAEAFNKKLEDSKQKVELDLTKYNDEQKELISHLEKGGSVIDFLNPMKKYTDFLGQDNKSLVEAVLKADGVEDLESVLEDMEIEGTLDSKAKEYRDQLYELQEQEMKDILQKAEEKRNSYLDQANSENEELIKAVESLKEYEGLEIPEKFKKQLVSNIKSGAFHKELNNAEAQLKAYLNLKVGPKVKQLNAKKITEASRDGFNKADEQHKAKLHNTPPAVSPNGHTKRSSKDSSQPFSEWADLI